MRIEKEVALPEPVDKNIITPGEVYPFVVKNEDGKGEVICMRKYLRDCNQFALFEDIDTGIHTCMFWQDVKEALNEKLQRL